MDTFHETNNWTSRALLGHQADAWVELAKSSCVHSQYKVVQVWDAVARVTNETWIVRIREHMHYHRVFGCPPSLP